MRLFPEWRQVRVCGRALRDGETHGAEHGIFFGFFDLALLFCEFLGIREFAFLGRVAFCVPVEIPILLPAAYRGHERVAQVVFALGVCFDIFPFEVGAAAAGNALAT